MKGRLLILAAVFSALVASIQIPASAGGASATGGAPADYTQIKGLSQPRYKTITEAVDVPMADGVNLYVEVTRPKAPGRFGVILEASPYHGTLADRLGTRVFPGPVDKDGNHIGLTGYFAPRGYAVVMVDLRGTGRSGGCLDHLGPNDASDLKTIVEWAAKQKWSNGRVGMTGHSYVGSTPMVAAAQNPKGLATIVPSAGLARMYDHKFQNGVPYNLQWVGPLIAYPSLSTARHFPPQISPVWEQVPAVGSKAGDDFGNDMESFGCGWLANTGTTGDAFLRGYEHAWDTARDWARGATKADIPVFIVHGVNDNAARIAAADWFFKRSNPQDKAWIGQWDHGSGKYPNSRTCPQTATTCKNDQWTEALHAWFDKQLLGLDVDTGPALEAFLNDREVFTAESWPSTPSRYVSFYPASGGALGTKPGDEGSVSFIATPQQHPNGQVVFESEPLKQDMLIVGIPKLQLAISQTSPLLHVNATLFDVSAAEADAIGKANWAIQPELREGINKPQPVIPGEVMTIKLDSMAQAHLIEKGHTLRFVVSSYHPDKVPTLAFGGQITVYLGKQSTSFRLPVIDNPVLYSDVCRGLEPVLKTATCFS